MTMLFCEWSEVGVDGDLKDTPFAVEKDEMQEFPKAVTHWGAYEYGTPGDPLPPKLQADPECLILRLLDKTCFWSDSDYPDTMEFLVLDTETGRLWVLDVNPEQTVDFRLSEPQIHDIHDPEQP